MFTTMPWSADGAFPRCATTAVAETCALSLLVRLEALQPVPCTPYSTATLRAALEGPLPAVRPTGRVYLPASRIREALGRALLRGTTDESVLWGAGPFGDELDVSDFVARLDTAAAFPAGGTAPVGSIFVGLLVLRNASHTAVSSLVAALEIAALDGLAGWSAVGDASQGACKASILALAETSIDMEDSLSLIDAVFAGEDLEAAVARHLPADTPFDVGENARYRATHLALLSPLGPFGPTS